MNLKRLKYYLFFGFFAFFFVLEAKISEYVAQDIKNKRNEIAVLEREIASLKQEIDLAVGITEIRTYAEAKRWTLKKPMNIITLESRRNSYTIKGQNHNIVEQILTLWE
jgi:hypothetical protein